MNDDGVIPTALVFVRDAGMLGVFIVAMIGGWKRWWVWGWQLDECCAREALMRQERDEYRRMILHAQSELRQAQQAHTGEAGC